MTDLLKARCRSYYGVPIREFLERLLIRLQSDRVAALEAGLQTAREQYLRELKRRLGAKQPLERASSRFATVYAAGVLAIGLGVLNWPKSALGDAVLSCQLDGLKEVAATEPGETISSSDKEFNRAMGKKLVEYFRRNQSKSMDLRRRFADPKTHKFGSVPYYIANHRGKKYFYLTADGLKLAIGRGADANRYKRNLVDRAYLDVSTGGKTGQRFVVQRRIFAGKGKEGMKWVHALKMPIRTSA